MTWMAPMPTSDTRLAAHWVRTGTEYVPTSRLRDGSISPPGWRSVCEMVVLDIYGDDADYGPPRPVCPECAEVAPYPYSGRGEQR